MDKKKEERKAIRVQTNKREKETEIMQVQNLVQM